MSESAKRILIVCQLDGFANTAKAVAAQHFLEARGHAVQFVDTYHLSRASGGTLGRKLPGVGLTRLALYATEAASVLLTRRSTWGRRHLSYYGLIADYRLRRRILESSLRLDDFDLVICETPHDAGILTAETAARTLYDCPTPWADEPWLDRRLTERQHRKLRRLETELYESVDYLAFHWETYGRYAVDHYGISGRNLITLNRGCTPAMRRAEFEGPPRIVYIGSLQGRAIDLPGLSRLTKLYPYIDVYGGPPPDPRLGLNYLGYASLTVLQQYQLGLITSSKDELRREGFSAKHVDYLAYGLPVLVPAWRRNLHLLRGSVPYDEQTFTSVIETLSTEAEWQRVSDEAYAQAQRLAWDEVLRPLESVLSEC